MLTKVDLPRPDWPAKRVSKLNVNDIKYNSFQGYAIHTNHHHVELETSFEKFLFNLLSDGVKTNVAIKECL